MFLKKVTYKLMCGNIFLALLKNDNRLNKNMESNREWLMAFERNR